MPKPTSPRPILRNRPDGSHVVFTRNLGALRRRLGPDVFNAFAAAFLQVDRVDSLIAFLHLNATHLAAGSEQRARNDLTASVFLMGTMFELSLALDRLRSVLIRRKLIGKHEWVNIIGARWDSHWRASAPVSTFRNKAAFHIDSSYLEVGLDALPQAERLDLFRYASERRQEGIFLVGSLALKRGLTGRATDVDALLTNAIPDLNAYQPLTELFLHALNSANLTPKLEGSEA